MDWFRWHHGTAENGTWRAISRRSGQPVHAVLAVWALLYERASKSEERGTVPEWDDEAAGAALDLEADDVRAIREAMHGKVLDGFRILAWDKEQPKREREDSSAERVQRYRDRVRKNGGSVGGYLRHHAALMERDGGRCVYCGTDTNLCIDHLTPVQQGGTDDVENLAIACKACNSGKSGRTPEEAGYVIRCHAAATAYATWLSLSRHVTPKGGKSRRDKKRVEERRLEAEGVEVEIGSLSSNGGAPKTNHPPGDAGASGHRTGFETGERMTAPQLLGAWINRQRRVLGKGDYRPSEQEAGRFGSAAKRICEAHPADEIRAAFYGMDEMWPHAPPKREPWTLETLEKKFPAALAASMNHPEIQAARENAELDRALEAL